MSLTVEEWREWSGNGTKPSSSLVQAAIDSAKSAIAGTLARNIATPTASAARKYAPRGHGSLLSIHDAATVTVVVDNGTTLTLDIDYQLEPLNSLTADGQYSPYTHLRRLGGSWWTVDNDKATITVTGTWGWTTVPPRYVEALKVLTSDILQSAEVRNGIVAFADYGAVRARENPTVALLLNGLTRSESWGIA